MPLVCILTACASPGLGDPSPDLSDRADSILGGEPDTTHQAVMWVLQDYGGGVAYACSGTMFHVDAAKGVGHVLTAAHCLAPPPGTTGQQPASKFQVRQGNDGAASSAVRYTVTRAVAHPSWKATRDAHDLAVLEVQGVQASTPTLPLVTKLQDEAYEGMKVLSVGYGVTQEVGDPSGQNSIRHRIQKTLSSASPLFVQIDKATDGPCRGDSGGPFLVVLGGAERVSAVVSFTASKGKESCFGIGVGARVAPAADWIAGVVSGADTLDAPTCGECIGTVANGTGTCAAKLDTCLGDDTCKKQLACYDACTNTKDACKTSCGPLAPALTTYFACEDQVCGTACAPTCGFSFDHSRCDACQQSSCCGQYTACANDSTCRACGGGAMTTGCEKNTAFAAVDTCFEKYCKNVCKRDSGQLAPTPPPDTSSGSAGAAGGKSGKTGATPRKSTIPEHDGACAYAPGRSEGHLTAALLGAIASLVCARKRRGPGA